MAIPPFVNPNWFSNLIEYGDLTKCIYYIVAIALNTMILVISAKKKREKEHTYRIIIVYISWMAITKDIARLYDAIFQDNLLSGMFHHWRLRVALALGHLLFCMMSYTMLGCRITPLYSPFTDVVSKAGAIAPFTVPTYKPPLYNTDALFIITYNTTTRILFFSVAFLEYLQQYNRFWYDMIVIGFNFLNYCTYNTMQFLIPIFSINRFLAVVHPYAYVFIRLRSIVSLLLLEMGLSQTR
jgi:hypothetical protein